MIVRWRKKNLDLPGRTCKGALEACEKFATQRYNTAERKFGPWNLRRSTIAECPRFVARSSKCVELEMLEMGSREISKLSTALEYP